MAGFLPDPAQALINLANNVPTCTVARAPYFGDVMACIKSVTTGGQDLSVCLCAAQVLTDASQSFLFVLTSLFLFVEVNVNFTTVGSLAQCLDANSANTYGSGNSTGELDEFC